MKKETRILYVEDVPADVMMANHELRKAGMSFRVKRVETRDAFTRELEAHPPDLILSDHGLPTFDGFAALAIAREKCPDVPFIFVTGSLGEETAIKTFESGATDYVLKKSLHKLAPAIQRALREAEERAALRRREQELRESESLKTAILDTVLDAIISIDHRGSVQEWNPAADKMFGYSRHEALGQAVDELIVPPALRQAYKDGLAHYLITGAGSLLGRPIQLTLRRRDGQEFRAELAVTRIPTETPPRCTALIRDITERQAAEHALRQSEERFRMLVENVKDYAIYLLDPEGKVATWNAGAQAIEGYTAEDIIGRHFSCIFAPEDLQRGRPEQLIAEAAAAGSAVDEGWRVRQDGSRYWTNMVLTALRDPGGGLTGYSKISRDITERRQAMEEVRRLNAELEQRVQERTAQLEIANQELESFCYSVSHDLRAPLRHVVGYVEILQAESVSRLDDQVRQNLQIISDSARQMGHLIDALLAFSRMGRAEMRQQQVNLGVLVKEARSELREEIAGRRIEWKVDPLPDVQGDPLMLRQVVINLISNALKYTRTRNPARIEIGATAGESETTCFVRDNGVGFDMQYSDKLFGVFQRLHRPSEFEGTGIGLANVRRIIHRHGGQTWADSAIDRGATFFFSIPHPAKGVA